MIHINLLSWREQAHRKKFWRMMLFLILMTVIFMAIVVVCLYQSHEHLHEEKSRNQSLVEELARLHALPTPQSDRRHPKEVVMPKRPKQKVFRTQTVSLHYAKASEVASMIQAVHHPLLSLRGKLIMDPRTNQLWIEDTDPHLQQIMRLIHQIDIPAPQIEIEARLVNINEESARDLGIRLGLLGPPSSPVGPRMGVDLAAIPMAASAASLGLTQAILNSQRLLDIELSALESSGQAKVIASPRLVTTNQMAAVIESGEDIPYQEFAANGTTSVAFKKAVLRLKVTPQMTVRHELMMNLVINQDSDSGKRVQGVPIIATKSIETEILVHHGQTIVLGGIYQQDQNHQADQIPVLGSLPWIGALFKRKQMRSRHEALLIFMTPRILGEKD